MRAHIVLRNSTDRQAKAGTVNAQRAPVRELAQRCGADDLVEYVEEGISGNTPLDERDVMRRLLADAKPGELVCAFDMSRLTRAESMLQRYKVLGHLADAGVRLATVDDGEIDLGSVGGRITLHVKGEIASDERKKIRARLTAGKDHAAKEGRKPAGSTPYGWRYDKTTCEWSLVEPEASVRREILQRLIGGESTIAVADDFQSRGIKYPARKGSQSVWTARRVWHFATQPINKGEWSFDGYAIKVPALVDADTFARVQVALSKNQERGRCRTQHVYLLDGGHGRCGLCGAPLRIQWGGSDGDVPYYVCANRLADKSCELPWWRVDEADALVWGEARKVLERPDLVEEALHVRSTDTDVAAKDVADGEAQLAQLKESCGSTLRRANDGLIDQESAESELRRLKRKRLLLEETIAAAREAAERAQAAVTEIGAVRAWLALVREEIERADAAERRRICRALAPTVSLTATEIKIGLKLRGPNGIVFVGSNL